MAAKRSPIYPVDRFRIRSAIAERGLSVADVAARAGCDRSVVYRIRDGSLASSTKLKRIYDTLDLDRSLINRHEPDVESLIADLYDVKDVFPEVAQRYTKEVAARAADARAWREEQEKLEKKRLELVRAADSIDAASSGR